MDKLRFDLELNSQGYVEGAEQASYTTKELKKSTEDYIKSFGPLKKQMREAKTEALNLASQFANLSRAEQQSEFGKALKEEMELAIQKAAELQDVMGDTQQAIKNAASDTQTWDTLKEGIEIGKSAALAYASAIAQVTGNEEDLAKMVKTLTTIENTFNTAIKIGNAIQEQSALMTGIRRLQKWAAGVAEEMETKAKIKNTAATVANTAAEKANAVAKGVSTKATVAGTAATEGATVAQRVFNAVAKANPYVLLATVAITAATAIGGYMLATSKASKEEKKAEEQKKRLASAQDKYYNTYASTLSGLIIKYRQLSSEWRSLSSEHEKKEWIKENKDEWEKLGLEINNVNDAEKLFNNNSQFVIDGLIKRARAAAYAAQAQDLLEQSVSGDFAKRLKELDEEYLDKMQKARYVAPRYDKKTGDEISPGKSREEVQQELLLELENKKADIKMEQYELQQQAYDLLEKAAKEEANIVKISSKNNNNNNNNKTKEQLTELQRLNNIIKDLEDKKDNINPLDPKAEEDIKKLNKQIREAQTNVENFKIFVDFGLDTNDYKKLQQITGEINNIKNQIDDLDETSPDYLNQFDELNNKLKVAQKNLSDFKFEVGIEISSKTFDQLQNLSDEIDKYKKEVEDIKLNPDFSDYNNKLKEAENKLEDALKNFQDFKLKLNISDDGFDKLQELANDVEKFKQKVEDIKLHPELPDYKKQLQEAEKELNDAFKKFNDYKFELGIDVSTDDYKKLQDLYNETQKLKQNVEDIKLNPDFSDYNNKLKEAEDKLKEATEKYQNLKVKVDFQIVNDPNKYINQLKDEQKKFEDAYKIAISVGDTEAANAAKEGYQKLQRQIDNYELEVKNLKINDIDIEHNTLKAKVDKALEDFKLAVKNDDEAAKKAARQAYNVAQKELDKYEAKLKIVPDSDLEDTLNKISKLKVQTPEVDFSKLSDGMREEVNKAKTHLDNLNEALELAKEKKNEYLKADDTEKVAAMDEEIKKLTEDIEENAEAYENLIQKSKILATITEGFSKAGEAVGAFGDMFNALGEAMDDNALKVVGIVAQAIATICLSYANALNSASKNWITWLAFGISGLATMVTMITQIKSLTAGYAEGGVVPGSSYTGDKLIARVNSGERILTAEQNKNLERIANGNISLNDGSQPSISFKIKGEDLWGTMKNYKNIHRIS